MRFLSIGIIEQGCDIRAPVVEMFNGCPPGKSPSIGAVQNDFTALPRGMFPGGKAMLL
jgi:hypothetical protein